MQRFRILSERDLRISCLLKVMEKLTEHSMSIVKLTTCGQHVTDFAKILHTTYTKKSEPFEI